MYKKILMGFLVRFERDFGCWERFWMLGEVLDVGRENSRKARILNCALTLWYNSAILIGAQNSKFPQLSTIRLVHGKDINKIMKNFRVTVIALTFMLVIGGVLHSTMKANMGLSNDLGSPDFNKRGAIDEDFGTQGDLKKIVNPRGAIYEFNNGIVGDIFVKKEDGHLVCTSPGEIHGVATGDTIVYELVVSEKDSYKLGQCYRIRGSLNDSFTEMRDINRINGYKYHKAWNVGSGAKVVPHVVIQAGNTFVEVANPRCKVSTVSPRRILFELNGWDVVVSPDGKLISAYLGGMTGYGVFDLKGQKIFSHSTGDRTWSSDSSKLFWINDGKVQVTKFDSEAGTVVGTSVVTLEN